MSFIQFLAEWALRSSILILSGALLLWAMRVKIPSIRLSAWTVTLFCSLAIPVLTATLPKVLVPVIRTSPGPTQAPSAVRDGGPIAAQPISRQKATFARQANDRITRFDWSAAALTIYIVVAVALLLRLCVGVLMSLRLLRRSHTTGEMIQGFETRESDMVGAPVTIGIGRPAIVLPSDWREWDRAKLDAVLAHEGAHIRRRDPARQLLSAIHRALLWHSPLSWFLHRRIVRAAEEASDDAAMAAIRDRALYAEVLLGFMQRGVRGANWLGVPMARYGRPEERIHRILDATGLPADLSRGIKRWSIVAILAMGTPLTYMVAAAHPQSAPQTKAAAAQPPALNVPQNIVPTRRPGAPVYLRGLGNVTPFFTVTVKPRVDGELMSVSFKEGDTVQEGQMLASIDPRPYQIQLDQAQAQLTRDQTEIYEARHAQNKTVIVQLLAKLNTDQANVDEAKLKLSYTKVTAPITGVTGLRLVDAGNLVHATDTTGLVIITQFQPIAVLFTVPEDNLPQVRKLLRDGATVPVEAWNRDNTVKLATGHLEAVDNQIDITTGTVKLKAVFDNKDEALFPNQFVNVHMLLNSQ